MNTLPHIAVIIPTLNEEPFIKRCLDSVFMQDYPMNLVNIMVVDGGSTDHTQEIVQSMMTTHSNLHLLPNPQKIQAVAFNIGVAHTDAPYIVRLDAHALYAPSYIRRCITHLLSNPQWGNVGGRCQIQPQNNSCNARANALLNQSRFGIGGAAFRVGEHAQEVDTVPFGAFPKHIIDQIGGMCETLARGEDNEYNARIRQAGYKIYFDPEIVATYFARATLSECLRQMFSNGKSIGILLRKYRQAVSLRHLIPLCFVGTLLLTGIGAIFWQPLRWIALLILVLYFLCALVASCKITKMNDWQLCLYMPILFFLVHSVYGIGTILGYFTEQPTLSCSGSKPADSPINRFTD